MSWVLPVLGVGLLLTSFAYAESAPAKLTTLDIRNYLLSNSPWVNPNNTVDTVKIGDPTREVKKAGVCWYPSIENIRAAQKAGCDLLICHEPTFWEHAAPEQSLRKEIPGVHKVELLEKTGMVILRAHDSWDQWPGIGIRDSWARFLGFDNRVKESGDPADPTKPNYAAIYAIPKQTLKSFAQYVANRIKPLGEDSVQVIGDPKRMVCRPAIGVGCAGPGKECAEAGADVFIVCYDGASYWSARERWHELGVAVLTVEHGTTEMPGLESLCKHLAEKFPQVTFQYFAEHARTWTVRGKGK